MAAADPITRLNASLAGRYRIERKLGEGGMAIVYLAEDLKHEREVAIKVLRPDLAASLGPDRFLREIRISATLQHPHILPLHDSGEAGELLFYVMPYVEGESLRERLARSGELPIPEAIRILRDVADALAAAHERGVVHRDIKPGNVLLTGRHALVTDFGVAKAVSEAVGTPDLTATGGALGTPAYMAPEQASSDPVDHRADIYAFGVLAYELLTGERPFEGRTAQAVLVAHLTDDPPRVASKRPTVPPELDALVLKCLAKRAADRWQSAAQLRAHLEQGMPPSGGKPLTSTRSTEDRLPRRRLGFTVGAAAVLAAGVVAIVALRSTADAGPDPRRVVVVPFEDRTGDTALAGVGALAAEWIPRELQRTLGGIIDVVPAATVRGAQRYGSEDPAPGATELAQLVAAGTAIAGTARLRGTRIQLEVEVIDAGSGSLLPSIEPVSAPRDSVEALMRTLGERVAIAVGVRFSPRFQWYRGRTAPPSLAAYREVRAGLEAFADGEYDDALTRWYRANRLDTSFVEPLLHAWAAHFALGQGRGGNPAHLQRAESLIVAIGEREQALSPYDRAEYLWKRAATSGDLEAEYRAAEAWLDVSEVGWYAAAFSALGSNRPERAVEVLSRWNVRGTWMERWPSSWEVLGRAHHDAGEVREALEATTRGRRQLPDDPLLLRQEVRYRAALGQVSELSDLLDQAFTLPGSPIPIVLDAAREYRAHDHRDAAMTALQRASEWLQSRPAGVRGTPEHRYDVARVLYWMERWEDAASFFQELVREDPRDVDSLGHLGVTLARSDRRDEALNVAERLQTLDVPYLYGVNTRWRAGIHAVLGDSAEAVRLLRQAISEGDPYTAKEGPEFLGLQGYAPFAELMRPRG